MFNLGFSEIVLIAVIALIFIGPKQLPEIARSIGRALNELKRASEDLTSSIANPKTYSHHNPNSEPKLKADDPANSAETPLLANESPQVENTDQEKGKSES